MLGLEGLKLIHGIITDHLQLLFVLIIDSILDFLPFVFRQFWLIFWLSPVSLPWSSLPGNIGACLWLV